MSGVARVNNACRICWEADELQIFTVCLASRLYLPPFLGKELARCQQLAESHYFITDNTNTTVVCVCTPPHTHTHSRVN